MKTFDLAEVRNFAAYLDSQMRLCDNGEGIECSTLDIALQHYAKLCCDYSNEVRQWGREIFTGRVAFDPKVEQAWREEGLRLFSRALEMASHGQSVEGPCYILDGQKLLWAALFKLHRLLDGWVTPKLAVGPSARQGLALNPSAAEEAHRRIDSLPPLPRDWQPVAPHQQALYRKLRTS
ncbi:hypothetical protein V5E97_03335 [Singulisphaera sp. Ch08]|uniref:Uncharacterized protein n=1 Tax=Singulisphaera sp. Ch08 TaxID=3120278 RepID=A0AAU7CIS3_9BACT